MEDDDIEKKGLRSSTLSSDENSTLRSEHEEIKETKADSIDSGEHKGAVDFGRQNLPPLYVDIQEEIEKNLQTAQTNFQ